MMLTPILTLDILISLVLVGLGSVILIRNNRVLSHWAFLIFAFSSASWILSNYFSNDQHLHYGIVLIANRFTLLYPGLALASLMVFVSTLVPASIFIKYPRILLTANLAAFALTLTPWVVAAVHKQGSVYAIDFGGLAAVYFAMLFIDLALIVVVLTKGIRKSKGDDKLRLKMIAWTSLTVLAINFFTNVFLPFFGNLFQLTNLGPLSTAFMVGGLLYSIARYRLFNIRLAIARSIAYLLSFSLIGVIYGALLIAVSSSAFFSNQPLVFQRSEYIAFAIATAFVYPTTKRFFDKVTDKIFYKDAYDTQAFLDELNQALVSSIELEKLLTHCAEVIAKNMKAEYCLFGIEQTAFKGVRIVGTTRKDFSQQDILKARSMTPHLGMSVIVVDYLPAELDKLKQLLVRNGIAVLVRLVPEFSVSRDGVEGLGYIMLGQKRSGNSYTPQDVRLLGTIASELVIAIQNSLHFEEIQRFNITLQQQVNDATRKLRRTNQRLRELDETKDDFISMASHQLRTPLTSVKGYLSLVLEGDAGKLNETQAKMLRQAFSSSQRMVFLITDLLNISRLKTGKFVIETTPVDLSALVQEEVEQLHESAEIKQITLSFTKPAAFPKLMLDETKVRQVIMNYIDNALYYTPVGGKVAVELTEKPATVELRVVDSGIGVPKAEQPHLFTKFYRATNARKARPDGTGLGLFMAKKAITAQGGSIVFSSHEGHGSTFGFVFSKTRLKVPENISAVQHSLTAQIDADVAADKKRQKQPA
ncbi:MAG TPA: ATP-binding protein [Candidatus Saccharimonadales bacterium]|nr:ATP-binding protein [Candidatus Saccharimonadales bacterium]